MESETKYGLRVHNTYDQVVAYIKADPTTIKFPNRSALFLQAHPIYGQLKDSMRTYSEGRQAQAAYEQGGNAAPFEPPQPRMRPPPPGGGPNVPPPADDDDMLPPPPDEPRNLIEPDEDPVAMGYARNGMQPPPPPPPPQTYASRIGQATDTFMASAMGAMGGAMGGAAGNAVIQGLGGVAESVLAGAAAPMAAAAAVGAASMAPAFVAEDIPMGSFREQRPNDRRNRDVPMRQQAQHTIQTLHNQGRGPAAFVDTRTLNGQNHLKPKDKKLPMTNSRQIIDPHEWEGYTGMIGGGSSSGSGGAPFGVPSGRASAQEPDLPPVAPPSFNDLLGKIKQNPRIGIHTRPRERSHSRAPNPDRKPNWTRLPQPESRAAAMAMRGPVVKQASKRKRDDQDPNPSTRKPRPTLTGPTPQARAGKRMQRKEAAPKLAGKRKREDEDPNPAKRRPPPKPNGRMNSRVNPQTKPPPGPPPSAPGAGKKMAMRTVKYM